MEWFAQLSSLGMQLRQSTRRSRVCFLRARHAPTRVLAPEDRGILAQKPSMMRGNVTCPQGADLSLATPTASVISSAKRHYLRESGNDDRLRSLKLMGVLHAIPTQAANLEGSSYNETNPPVIPLGLLPCGHLSLLRLLLLRTISCLLTFPYYVFRAVSPSRQHGAICPAPPRSANCISPHDGIKGEGLGELTGSDRPRSRLTIEPWFRGNQHMGSGC